MAEETPSRWESDVDTGAIREEARGRAAEQLPCQSCGSDARPLVRKPRPGSVAWWDDPSCYMGCADCGHYLADLPDAYPFIWSPEVPQDSEPDPEGSSVSPREFD